jgi:hypothetical protein
MACGQMRVSHDHPHPQTSLSDAHSQSFNGAHSQFGKTKYTSIFSIFEFMVAEESIESPRTARIVSK